MNHRVTRLPGKNSLQFLPSVRVKNLLSSKGIPAQSLPTGLHYFMNHNPKKVSRLVASLRFYATHYEENQKDLVPSLDDQAVLHKLTNPCQLPAHNALCAYNFANPGFLAEEYAEENEDEYTMVQEFPEIAQYFLNHINPYSRVLSLGFGEATLEKQIIETISNTSVTGVEFIEKFAKHGADLGISAIQGNIHDVLDRLGHQQAVFDTIIISEVLGDLDSYLLFSQLRPLLAPSAKILALTFLPAFVSDETGYERMWTPNLERILHKEGLRIIEKKVWQHIEQLDEVRIKEIPEAYDLEDAYVFYVISKRGKI